MYITLKIVCIHCSKTTSYDQEVVFNSNGYMELGNRWDPEHPRMQIYKKTGYHAVGNVAMCNACYELHNGLEELRQC